MIARILPVRLVFFFMATRWKSSWNEADANERHPFILIPLPAAQHGAGGGVHDRADPRCRSPGAKARKPRQDLHLPGVPVQGDYQECKSIINHHRLIVETRCLLSIGYGKPPLFGGGAFYDTGKLRGRLMAKFVKKHAWEIG